MSGIITGPYFRQFFNSPGPLEVGTMVAVLELGALGTSISSILFPPLTPGSHVHRCWPCGRHHRTKGNTLRRCTRLHCWRCRSDVHYRLLRHDYRPCHQWLRCWPLIVSDRDNNLHLCLPSAIPSTIVPIYQSEISPPNHVRTYLAHFRHNLIPVQRGALACMEFTGNIAGYATSVVSLYFFNSLLY